MNKIKIKMRAIVMSKLFKKIIVLAPFIMLFITMVTTFTRLFSGYSDVYNYLSQIIGYSILTNIYMVSNAIRNRYCDYSLISIFSLLLLNVSNVLAMSLNLLNNDFYVFFDAILILALFRLALVKFLKNKQVL